MTTPSQTRWERVEPGIAASLMGRALKKSESGFLYQSRQLAILYRYNLPPTLGDGRETGASDREIFGALEGDRLEALKRTVLDGAEPVCVEIQTDIDGIKAIFRVNIERLVLDDTDGVISIVTDISDMRHREKVLKTLLRELSHRSKNLLAIILGIATQTARQARSLDGFLVAFRGRIQSMSNSQDLITDSSWRGAFLFELAHRQFGNYWSNPAKPIKIIGVDAHLSPNAALHVGLALHELIVNSASHGAIAAGLDVPNVSCAETVAEEGTFIRLVWSERRASIDTRPELEEDNFTRTVLERVVPAAIGGKASYTASADLLEYSLTIPAREYEILR